MNATQKIVTLLELQPQVLQLSADDRWALLKLLVESLQPENLVNPLTSKPDNDLGWTPGFFERTAGAWQGEPLERGHQGDGDRRDWGSL
jgi:hypothetical protein